MKNIFGLKKKIRRNLKKFLKILKNSQSKIQKKNKNILKTKFFEVSSMKLFTYFVYNALNIVLTSSNNKTERKEK